MPNDPSNSPPPLPPSATPAVGCIGYLVGLCSFIPWIGVLFGAISIAWGIARRAWILVGLGAGGILLSVVLYASFYLSVFHERGGTFDKLRSQMAVTMLNDAVRDIEFYKLQHGRYPTTLREVDTKDKNEFPTLYDPTVVQRSGTKDPYFFYALDPTGNFYYLRSVGQDGVPFTADDILPSLSEEERKNTGLRLTR